MINAISGVGQQAAADPLADLLKARAGVDSALTEAPAAGNNVADLLNNINEAPQATTASNTSAEQLIAKTLFTAVRKELPQTSEEALKAFGEDPSKFLDMKALESLTSDASKLAKLSHSITTELSSIASNTHNAESPALDLAINLLKSAVTNETNANTVLEKSAIRQLAEAAYDLGHSSVQGGSLEASTEHKEKLEAKAKEALTVIPDDKAHLLVNAMINQSLFRPNLQASFGDIFTKALKNEASAIPAIQAVVKGLAHILNKIDGEPHWHVGDLSVDEKSSLEMISKAVTDSGTSDKHALHLKTQIDTALTQSQKGSNTEKPGITLESVAKALGSPVETVLGAVKQLLGSKQAPTPTTVA